MRSKMVYKWLLKEVRLRHFEEKQLVPQAAMDLEATAPSPRAAGL